MTILALVYELISLSRFVSVAVQLIVHPAAQSTVQLALQLVRCFSTLSFVSLMFLETPFVLVHVLEMIQNTHEDRISRECSFFCIPQKCTSLFVCPFSFKTKMERKKMGGSTTIEFFFQKSFFGSFLLSNKPTRLSSSRRGQIHTRKPHFLSECARPHEIALSSETLGQTARDCLRPCMPLREREGGKDSNTESR